jgi:hypothetical protein
MKPRNILLLEPNYKNKYPPIGLMKIATYHRLLGDNVRFFKGDLRSFILDEITEECLSKLTRIDNSIIWLKHKSAIKLYIKTKQSNCVENIDIGKSRYFNLIFNCLDKFSDHFRKGYWKNFPQWDRVYVTTLFTFYWKITIETIEFAKYLTKSQSEVLVGGVMASLLHKEILQETGINPHQGLLDKPGMLDPDIRKACNIIIDDLPLDYSILDEIDYEYPTRSAYFTFMTKGCTRKCAFCSVPILEPIYKPKIDTSDKFDVIKRKFGEQQNLLLMDNNVLASPKFLEIIDEIKSMGFYKGATFIEPNQLDIAINNLKKKTKNNNNVAYIKRCFKLIHSLFPRLRGDVRQQYYNVLFKYDLNQEENISKENLLEAYLEIKDIYEKYRPKIPKLRYVDFNQGTDARYVTDEIMRKMSEIPIKPLRIAFDYIGIKEQYINAVRLAAKYGIGELSNYILFNFHDKPEDLWQRLKINVDLSRELGIDIYSFPMKYIPLFGEDAKHREFTGKHWNKKFIRAIQSILNVTRGIVAPPKKNDKLNNTFFEKAFGKDIDEFFEILYMPENYIVYRNFFEEMGLTDMWRKSFKSLTAREKAKVLPIIASNNFNEIFSSTKNKKVLELFRHYTIKHRGIDFKDFNYKQTKKHYQRMITEDHFIDLTLTYDFEGKRNTKRRKLKV